MDLNTQIAFKIFEMGVDYGQLIMERERETEELADALNGYFVARKTAMPSQPIERRRIHSEKWFNAKKKSFEEFKKLLADLNT